jgi:hypothetical protein
MTKLIKTAQIGSGRMNISFGVSASPNSWGSNQCIRQIGYWAKKKDRAKHDEQIALDR